MSELSGDKETSNTTEDHSYKVDDAVLEEFFKLKNELMEELKDISTLYQNYVIEL